MNDAIRFSFEGENYEVDASTYPNKDIFLPDGRMFAVKGWRETFPYQIVDLQLIYLSSNFNRARKV